MLSNLGLWHLLILLAFALPLILALVSIIRTTRISAGYKALWALAVIAFPLLGPLLWFLFGRNLNPGPSAPH